MRVVCALELILDQDPQVGTDVLAEDVCSKGANCLLLCLELELEAERFA